ncbi:MAG: HAMP domain-containing protein, partial [Chloroflexi bacterium]|nr:HAMP domain-containing protein [Chloroflexota bacterium]
IPEFQNELENLVETHDTAVYIEQNPTEHLEQLSKGTSAFRELIAVDKRLNVIATYPPTNDTSLNADEVDELQDNPDESTMETIGSEFSFIVPLKDSNNEPIGAIIGRAHPFALNKLIVSLQGTAEGGIGFIVNEMDEIIAHPIEDELTAEWIPNENGRFFETDTASKTTGAYQSVRADNTRELVYYQRELPQPWTVVLSVPYAVVLDQAFSIGAPLLLALLFVTIASSIHLAYQSKGISRPITEIVDASKTMAAGENWMPSIHSQREDEIGQLGKAFAQMQRSMKKRLNELSLLLNVSQNVSTNIDLNQGMPAILRGALRGTGASGARAVVLNPSGGNPLTFGEGPAATTMATLDRRLMTKLRYAPELILGTPDDIRVALEFEEDVPLSVP